MGSVEHAITVSQPWAHAIAIGRKPVENRGRQTTYRGLLAIHAGKLIDGDGTWDGARGARLAWHLVLADVVPLPEPVYVHGQQMVPWRLPTEVAEQVTAQLKEDGP